MLRPPDVTVFIEQYIALSANAHIIGVSVAKILNCRKGAEFVERILLQ